MSHLIQIKKFITFLYRLKNIKRKSSFKSRTLMYHRVFSGFECDEDIWSINLDNFKEHINFLIQSEQLNIYDCEKILEKSQEDNAISISFDDATIDCYEIAAPILIDLNIPFTIFVITNYAEFNKKGFMTIKQIEELANNPLVSIGSHTKNHKNLKKCSKKELSVELLESKIYLEDQLGKEISMISYPFGKYNSMVKKLTKEYKYKYAFSSDFNYISNKNCQFNIPRTEIWNTDSLNIFKEKLYGEWDWLKHSFSK